MKTTVAIVGLGSRGRVTYAPIAKQYPDLMEITALADLNPACVEEAAKEYNEPKERCFTSAEELLAQPKLADAIFICTQDQDHVREALLALEKGYHILMEKPISPSAEDCNKLLEASRKYDNCNGCFHGVFPFSFCVCFPKPNEMCIRDSVHRDA